MQTSNIITPRVLYADSWIVSESVSAHHTKINFMFKEDFNCHKEIDHQFFNHPESKAK